MITDKDRYIKSLKNIFSKHSKKEKEYINQFTKNIEEFNEDYPNSSYDEFVNKFGTPKQVFLDYMSSQEESYLIDKINIKNDILKLIIIICAIALCLGLWKAFLVYRDSNESANQRITEVEILSPEEIE